MKKKFLFFLLSLFLLSFFLIYHFHQKKYVHKEIEKKADNLLSRPFLLINVLEKEEFDDAHIIDSISVPFDDVEKFLQKIEDKEKPLIFYCSNYWCTACHDSAKIAIKKGFFNTQVYSGGMAEWYQYAQKDPSFRYEGEAKKPYLSIVIFQNEEELEEKTHEKYRIISARELQKLLG